MRKSMRSLALIIGLIGAAILPHECSAQILDNPFSEYIQREVTITPGGGNANDTNAAIHTIDPWPHYAPYTQIPGNGQESERAVDQLYKKPGALGAFGSSGQSSTTTNIGGPGGITTSTSSGGGGGY
jgi:hypothetical protein